MVLYLISISPTKVSNNILGNNKKGSEWIRNTDRDQVAVIHICAKVSKDNWVILIIISILIPCYSLIDDIPMEASIS